MANESGHEPLDNPRWERYAQDCAAGKSKRQAMLSAYPARASWKPECVATQASKLEREHPTVILRINYLKAAAARAATITRTEIIDGMAVTFRKATEMLSPDGKRLDGAAVRAVNGIGATLLGEVREDREPDAPGQRDFGLLIGPAFLEQHRLVSEHRFTDFWDAGGRGSLKSSTISLEVVYDLHMHPDHNAVAFMKTGEQLRWSVFEQVRWAVAKLGLEDEFDSTVSPMVITRTATGQKIVFKGCDDPSKQSKGIKLSTGYVAVVWFEEVDQFHGPDELRTVTQSLTRGGDDFLRFYSFNPPRSSNNWVSRHLSAISNDFTFVHRSTYLDAPAEWLGRQFALDAEDLRARDPDAYAHEYLGQSNGLGDSVFCHVEWRDGGITDDEIGAIDDFRFGVDWGWEHPWAFSHLGIQAEQHRVFALGERCGSHVEEEQQAKMVLSYMAENGIDPQAVKVVCDSAQPASVNRYRKNGIPHAYGANKQKVPRLYGLGRMGQAWTWVIDPKRTPRLADEVRRMVWAKTRDGEVTGDVVKAMDDMVDASRYAMEDLLVNPRR